MTNEALAFDPFTAHRQFARVPPHCGTATFQLGDTIIFGAAEFLLPAAGHAIVAVSYRNGPRVSGLRARLRHQREQRTRVVPTRVPPRLRADFSEEHDSFAPADPNAPDA